eukprot:Sspe_Gene.119864::Locus_116998_Transcript_1_2_Confidence_0.667_Length_717::g.119864::m.119864
MWLWLKLRKFMSLPGDTPEEVTRKSLWAVVGIVYFFLSIGTPIRMILGEMDYENPTQLSILLHAVTNIAIAPHTIITRRVPLRLIKVVGAEMTFAILLSDFGALYESQNRPWPIALCVFSFYILLDLSFTYITMLSSVVCIYHAVIAYELAYSFGLRSAFPVKNSLCTCDDPPCVQPTFMNFLRPAVTAMSVVLLCVLLINRFAHDLKREKRSVEASVELA